MDTAQVSFLRKQIRARDAEISHLNEDREKLIDALHIFGARDNESAYAILEWLRKEIFT